MTNTNLENMVIEQLKSGQCPVERALLVVSGLENEKQIRAYERKLDLIQEDFERRYSVQADPSGIQTARALFDYLWEIKPDRYNSESLLAKVIDNQLDGDKNTKVGDCVGLTSLYSVLGLRLGLDLSVLFDEKHVLNLFSFDGREIVVENTEKWGFNDRWVKRSAYGKGDLTLLVATAFNNRGVAKTDLRDLQGAIADYDHAIELKPDYADAIFNRRIAIKMIQQTAEYTLP